MCGSDHMACLDFLSAKDAEEPTQKSQKNTGVILQVLHNSGALAPLLARRSFAKEGG
jgi:hypothetical protein